jgi:hypothetical protein
MLRGRGGSERGSVAITVALALTLLLGLAALVVDVGLNWAARTSAQTAADSAALAGASRLEVDGPSAAIGTVEDLLGKNLVTPGPAGWALDGQEDNGEVVCWTLPDPPPATIPPAGFRCPAGSNALRVITPPINVQYAFAPVLGKRSNSIKAMAAAAAGPAAPNNCVLCVLEPTAPDAMLLNPTDTEGIRVDGGGIVVNSRSSTALRLLGLGDVTAQQIRVLGNVSLSQSLGGQLLPPAELGGPPAVDPLADLPPPDQLGEPPQPPAGDDTPVITADTTLPPRVYRSIDVRSGALTLEEGVYVITDFVPGVPEFPGFVVRNGGRVEGDGATIYLACEDYPAPCSGAGARFRVENGGQVAVGPSTSPTTRGYAGLSIFADKGNTRTMRLLGEVDLWGAVYAASGRLVVNSPDRVEIHGLVAVDRLLKANTGPLEVTYNPASPLIGIGRPVLIR